MFVVHVYVHIKDGSVEAFKNASLENARNSVQEPGVARFDVVQQQDDPAQFVLVEAYRTVEDLAPSTNYWFSVRANDEVPKWNGLLWYCDLKVTFFCVVFSEVLTSSYHKLLRVFFCR